MKLTPYLAVPAFLLFTALSVNAGRKLLICGA